MKVLKEKLSDTTIQLSHLLKLQEELGKVSDVTQLGKQIKQLAAKYEKEGIANIDEALADSINSLQKKKDFLTSKLAVQKDVERQLKKPQAYIFQNQMPDFMLAMMDFSEIEEKIKKEQLASTAPNKYAKAVYDVKDYDAAGKKVLGKWISVAPVEKSVQITKMSVTDTDLDVDFSILA